MSICPELQLKNRSHQSLHYTAYRLRNFYVSEYESHLSNITKERNKDKNQGYTLMKQLITCDIFGSNSSVDEDSSIPCMHVDQQTQQFLFTGQHSTTF
jgi:hypothetical protein